MYCIDTIHTLDAAIVFSNIPHRFINKEVRMQINCRDFITVDTIIILSKSNTIDIHRDCSVYGNLRFMLWNPDTEQTAQNTEIEIDGHKVLSDNDGYVTITIPLAEQKEFYPISSNALLIENGIVNGHCGPDDIIEFKNQ